MIERDVACCDRGAGAIVNALARRAELGSLVQRETPTLSTLIRVAIGVLVGTYFADAFTSVTAVIGVDGLWRPDPVPSEVPSTLWTKLAELLNELGPGGLRAWFAVGCALSVLLAVGWASRLCAALVFTMAATTVAALPPIATFDDDFVRAAPLWLALAPTAEFACAGYSRARATVIGFRCLLVVLTMAYLDLLSVDGAGAVSATTLAVVAFASACLLAPWPACGYAALVTGGLAYADTNRMRGGLLCSTFLLWVLTILVFHKVRRLHFNLESNGASGEHVRNAMPTWDVWGALRVAVVIVLTLSGLASAIGSQVLQASTTAVRAEIGLQPILWNRRPWTYSAGERVTFVPDTTRSIARAVQIPDSWRARLLISWLGRDQDWATGLKRLLSRGIATAACRESLTPETGRIMVSSAKGARAVAWVECPGSGGAKVVTL